METDSTDATRRPEIPHKSSDSGSNPIFHGRKLVPNPLFLSIFPRLTWLDELRRSQRNSAMIYDGQLISSPMYSDDVRNHKPFDTFALIIVTNVYIGFSLVVREVRSIFDTWYTYLCSLYIIVCRLYKCYLTNYTFSWTSNAINRRTNFCIGQRIIL